MSRKKKESKQPEQWEVRAWGDNKRDKSEHVIVKGKDKLSSFPPCQSKNHTHTETEWQREKLSIWHDHHKWVTTSHLTVYLYLSFPFPSLGIYKHLIMLPALSFLSLSLSLFFLRLRLYRPLPHALSHPLKLFVHLLLGLDQGWLTLTP